MDRAAPSTALVLTPRSNPRHLFVRSQLPSTEAGSSITTSPVSVAGGKTSDEQTDDPSSSKQPGQPLVDGADGKQRNQETFHSPARDEMLEEDEDDDAQQRVSDAQVCDSVPCDLCDAVCAICVARKSDGITKVGASDIAMIYSLDSRSNSNGRGCATSVISSCSKVMHHCWCQLTNLVCTALCRFNSFCQSLLELSTPSHLQQGSWLCWCAVAAYWNSSALPTSLSCIRPGGLSDGWSLWMFGLCH